ncbi:MAG: GNAT family N-acetyltransferase [Candidatus Micrarchaeota archaeon]|nr:GNAT family N-acetyltransferase [Candidatus Micrarchaeota archaeon]
MDVKEEFKIRGIRRSDMKDIISCYYERYDEVKTNPDMGVGLYKKKPTMEHERKWFNEMMKGVGKGSRIFSVAEVNGRVVGTCDISPKYPNAESSHVGQLGISVRRGYRSMGIGTALIRHSIQRARKRYKIMALGVWSLNPRAFKLYKRMGFKTYGRLPEGVVRKGKKQTIIMMYRRL